MEAIVNEYGVLWRRFPKLTDLFPVFCRSNLERQLAEAKTWIGWQKKRAERIQQRYDALDRQCVALRNEVDGLRSRLYAAERQAEILKQVACVAVGAAEDLKRLYQAVAPRLDNGGFNLFYAAQDITGFCLYKEFPYEDACGCFEFLDGFELLRYLKAFEFGAIDWEITPGTGCRKAILREVDESTQAYREFERQLYVRALDRLGLRSASPSAQT